MFRHRILFGAIITACLSAVVLGAGPGAATTTPATRTAEQDHNDAIAYFQRLAIIERDPESFWNDAIRKVQSGDRSTELLSDIIGAAGIFSRQARAGGEIDAAKLLQNVARTETMQSCSDQLGKRQFMSVSLCSRLRMRSRRKRSTKPKHSPTRR